jgi:hypothetical protein
VNGDAFGVIDAVAEDPCGSEIEERSQGGVDTSSARTAGRPVTW